MKLPNYEYAVVPRAKVVGYLLSDTHRDGQHKTAFFKRFGFMTVELNACALYIGCVAYAMEILGFDHGVGHPLLLLCHAKAHNYRKNKALKDVICYSEWPKVADAVIKAEF